MAVTLIEIQCPHCPTRNRFTRTSLGERKGDQCRGCGIWIPVAPEKRKAVL